MRSFLIKTLSNSSSRRTEHLNDLFLSFRFIDYDIHTYTYRLLQIYTIIPFITFYYYMEHIIEFIVEFKIDVRVSPST